ncbi:hypothetical protein IMW82_16535 [Rhodanobacter sp. B2A1Ga4]|uniref:hypothetical protein n=1 Tax=Rhodanobacter sp. B2A1Ga4 TaxID=2778647 RepID=UPI001B3990A9|nr:hypothetical protein [Rhodanobacter sp. B2A1Ga4]MBQ4856276.1 hypothetical protein [Rhodanobacter sp. B2A1Ga4]
MNSSNDELREATHAERHEMPELEAIMFGRLLLAWSARCFTPHPGRNQYRHGEPGMQVPKIA